MTSQEFQFLTISAGGVKNAIIARIITVSHNVTYVLTAVNGHQNRLIFKSKKISPDVMKFTRPSALFKVVNSRNEAVHSLLIYNFVRTKIGSGFLVILVDFILRGMYQFPRDDMRVYRTGPLSSLTDDVLDTNESLKSSEIFTELQETLPVLDRSVCNKTPLSNDDTEPHPYDSQETVARCEKALSTSNSINCYSTMFSGDADHLSKRKVTARTCRIDVLCHEKETDSIYGEVTDALHSEISMLRYAFNVLTTCARKVEPELFDLRPMPVTSIPMITAVTSLSVNEAMDIEQKNASEEQVTEEKTEPLPTGSYIKAINETHIGDGEENMKPTNRYSISSSSSSGHDVSISIRVDHPKFSSDRYSDYRKTGKKQKYICKEMIQPKKKRPISGNGSNKDPLQLLKVKKVMPVSLQQRNIIIGKCKREKNPRISGENEISGSKIIKGNVGHEDGICKKYKIKNCTVELVRLEQLIFKT